MIKGTIHKDDIMKHQTPQQQKYVKEKVRRNIREKKKYMYIYIYNLTETY